MQRSFPAATVIVDTNIVVSSILSTRPSDIFLRVAARRALVGSFDMAAEARLVLSRMTGNEEYYARLLEKVLSAIEIVERERYAVNLAPARQSLLDAQASRNGSTSDAHILALAWTYDADIWSHDRDFAGTGWPSWSSANLASALAEEAGAEANNP